MRKGLIIEVSKALEIVRVLADGTDPYTGEVYPAESPYQNAETVRALFAAIDAVERAERRKRRKRREGLPERAGKPWDDKEESLLIKRFEEDVGVKKIAVEHKRTNGAIRSRLEKLGKICGNDNVEVGRLRAAKRWCARNYEGACGLESQAPLF